MDMNGGELATAVQAGVLGTGRANDAKERPLRWIITAGGPAATSAHSRTAMVANSGRSRISEGFGDSWWGDALHVQWLSVVAVTDDRGLEDAGYRNQDVAWWIGGVHQ